MGLLIAVEGIDGAGKRTVVDGLTRRWTTTGLTVTSFAFPRYGQALTADLASEALHGAHGDLRSSAYAMALLFALDRRDAADEIRRAVAATDIVVLDRYVASNAAYTAARLHEDMDGPATLWVRDLEFSRFGVPVPDRQLLLGVAPRIAMGRAASRAQADPGRPRDHYERDADLQHAVYGRYADLAATGWASPWTVVDDGTDLDGLAADIART